MRFAFQIIESQQGVWTDDDGILLFHLADLFHQFGRAAPFIELDIHLVDRPSADNRIRFLRAGAEQGGEAQIGEDGFFHGAEF